MKLVGLERLTPTLDETPDSSWIIPGAITADELKESLDLINKAEFDPPTFDDGQSAEDQLRRKSAARKRAAYDDDNDNDRIDGSMSMDEGEDFLFAPGGPTARKSTAEDKRPKKRQRRLRRADSEDVEGPTNEELDEKARARRQKELEKIRRIKSEMYVNPDDDVTTDEEIREKRKSQGQKSKTSISRLLAEEDENPDADLLFGSDGDGEGAVARVSNADAVKKAPKPRPKERRKRSSDVALDSSDEEGGSDTPASRAPTTSKRGKRPVKKRVVDDEDDEDEEMGGLTHSSGERTRSDVETGTVDTPLSSSPGRVPSGAGKALLTGDADDEDEDEDVAPVRQRNKTRAGFIVDSSDDE